MGNQNQPSTWYRPQSVPGRREGSRHRHRLTSKEPIQRVDRLLALALKVIRSNIPLSRQRRIPRCIQIFRQVHEASVIHDADVATRRLHRRKHVREPDRVVVRTVFPTRNIRIQRHEPLLDEEKLFMGRRGGVEVFHILPTLKTLGRAISSFPYRSTRKEVLPRVKAALGCRGTAKPKSRLFDSSGGKITEAEGLE